MPTNREYEHMMIELDQEWELKVFKQRKKHEAEVLALLQQIQALQAVITGGTQ